MIARCACLLGAVLMALASPAPASQAEPDRCRAAAVEAARRHGVPEEYMLAITLVETRRSTGGVAGPWPWTVNVAGQGYWFASRAEALAKAEATLAAGQRSFDVGCFQLNYRWHGAAFPGLDAMFEPMLGADYAARFLRDLHDETGDWMRAAGHYHSRTPVHGARYRRLVAAALESDALGPADLATLPEPAPGPARGAPLLAGAAGPLIALAGGPRTAATAGPARPGAVGLAALTSGRPLAAGPAIPLLR